MAYYGIVGEQAAAPANIGKLYQINKTNGATSLLYNLNAGVLPNAYQQIAFNPIDGLIYHIYGNSPDMSMETWDPDFPLNAPVFVADIGLLSQWTGIGYYGDSDLIGLIIGDGMDTLTTSGTATNIGAYIGATTYGVAVVRT